MAVYQYEFDLTLVGDFRLSRANYQIVQEGFRLLREELETWNQRAMQHGAARTPFEQEVADLTQLIEFGDQQLSQSYPQEIVVKGISVGNLRYVKAALMLVIKRREEDCARQLEQGWPDAAVRSLADSVEKAKKLVATIECEPSDILQEIMPKQPVISRTEGASQMEWDVFIATRVKTRRCSCARWPKAWRHAGSKSGLMNSRSL